MSTPGAGTAGPPTVVPAAAPAVRDAAERATRGRKLHMGHFAFMRAVVQGLDTRASWDRYLRIEGEHDDIRNVQRTINWIRDEFAAAAKRCARPGTARLVRFDVRRLGEAEPTLPTLEEFALAHGLEDFAQREQLAQYQAHYGNATTRHARRGRLIARQLDALAWLEQLVAQPPQSGDAVAAWLHPDLSARLDAAGIFTIRNLVDRINGLGLRWWSGIRAFGVAKAARITEWLAAHEASIGLAIGAHVRIKRSKLYAHELARVVPDSPRIDSASLFWTCASNWSINSSGSSLGTLTLVFLVLLVASVMICYFRYHLMTSFHTKILTGSPVVSSLSDRDQRRHNVPYADLIGSASQYRSNHLNLVEPSRQTGIFMMS